MRIRDLFFISLTLSALPAIAQDVQTNVVAGSAFQLPTSGSGKGQVYIVGPSQALRRDVNLGESVSFAAGELYSAGHYTVIESSGAGTKVSELNVVPAAEPASLGFLARPSRLPVNVHDGISGTAYVFDTYHNLITKSMPAVFELTGTDTATQTRNVTTHYGLAWTTLDSAAKQSAAHFTAKVGNVSSTRIINQVPGQPCTLSISATPSGSRLMVQTQPVKDCSGNAVPDGTIVTFTEIAGNSQSVVDVPLKQGVAKATMPASPGAKISVASGVVAGNEIRWGGGK